MGSKSGGLALKAVLIVAIVAAVAFILVPSLVKRSRTESEFACLSNIKRLGTAVLQYADDYDWTYPASKTCASTDPNSRQATQTIVNLLDPYLHNDRRSWRCPAQKGNSLYVKPESDADGIAGTIWPMHFTCNRNLLRPMGGEFSRYRYLNASERAAAGPESEGFVISKAGTPFRPVRVADIEQPSSLICIIEWHQDGSSPDISIGSRGWNERQRSDSEFLKIHPRGIHACYAAGNAYYDPFSAGDYGFFYPDERH